MQLETELNAVDRELLAEATEGFLPEQVFDFHAHVIHPRFYTPALVFEALAGKTVDFAAYRAAVQQLLPGRRLAGSLVFPYTARGNDRPGVNRWMWQDLAAAPPAQGGLGLALVAPGDDPALAAEWLSGGLCRGLKPYFLYGRDGDASQCGVEEYAPAWMWELCDRHEAVLTLHLVKDAAVADPANREALLRLSARYPRCRVVLAHIARSFNWRNARGLTALQAQPNIFVDTSAVTEPEGIKIALATLGPNRVLFGTDYPESHLRGRCVTAGKSAQWIYADTLNNPAMTLVGIESLRSIREACAQLGLGAAEVERIFWGNARSLLGRGAAAPA